MNRVSLHYPATLPNPVRVFSFTAALAFTCIFTLKSIQIHDVLGTSAYDLGIFDQHIWLLSQSEAAFNTVRGIHGFGDHFRPIEFLFVPLYTLYPNVYWTFLIQALSVAAAGLILFYLVGRVFPESPTLALGFFLSFLLNPAVHNTLLWQYHGFVLVTGFAMGMLAFYVTDRFKSFFFMLVLALFCREEVGFIFLLFGFVALVQRRWSYGILTIVISSLWLLFVFSWALPHFNGQGYFYLSHSNTGIATNWLDLGFYRKQLLSEETLRYLGVLFLPLFLLPLLSGIWMVPLAPMILLNIFIGTYKVDINYHYQALIMPFLYIATLFALRALIRRFPQLHNPYFLPSVGVALLASAILSFNWASALHPKDFTRDFVAWRETAEIRQDIARLNAELGEDSGVAASDFLLPHFSQRKSVYLFPNPWKVHYWGIAGEAPHHPNSIDAIVVSPHAYSEHLGLFWYLEENGFFEVVKETPRMKVLRRISPEHGSRDEAVAQSNLFDAPLSGLTLSNIRVSAPFEQAVEDFGNEYRRPRDCGVDQNLFRHSLGKAFETQSLDLDFTEIFGSSPVGSVYVCADVAVEESLDAVAVLGSDDGLTFWLNGSQKLFNPVYRSAHLGDDSTGLTLKKGINELMFRVTNIGGDWRLAAKILPFRKREGSTSKR